MTKQEKDAIIKLINSKNYDMFVTAMHLITAMYEGMCELDHTTDEWSWNKFKSVHAEWKFRTQFQRDNFKKFVDSIFPNWQQPKPANYGNKGYMYNTSKQTYPKVNCPWMYKFIYRR